MPTTSSHHTQVLITAFLLCCVTAASVWVYARRAKSPIVYIWAGNPNRVPPKAAVAIINIAGEDHALGHDREFFLAPSADLLEMCRLMFPGAIFLFED